MEQNSPVIAKKVWSTVRVMFFMLKKGITKRKFLVDLNMMMKRGKIAGKDLQNLMFRHHHNWPASAVHRRPPPAGEYEFSCRNTPPYPLSLFSTHKKHQNKNHHLATPKTSSFVGDRDDIVISSAVMKALGMLTSATASPALPGLGRITDSPFPLSNGDEDVQVDEAAEKFIRRFYNDLRREN